MGAPRRPGFGRSPAYARDSPAAARDASLWPACMADGALEAGVRSRGAAQPRAQTQPQAQSQAQGQAQSPSQVARLFFAESSIHGLRYLTLPRVSLAGKACWLVALLTCAGCAGVFVAAAWRVFRDAPTRTVVESTHFPLQRVPFPAVTLCPALRVRQRAGMELLIRFLNATAEEAEDPELRRALWNVMAALSMHQFPFHFRMAAFLNASRPLHARLASLNLTDFMHVALPPCDLFFRACFWQGTYVDCCEVFRRQRMEAGFCYSFNSLTADRTQLCPATLELAPDCPMSGGGHEECAGGGGAGPCALRRNGVSGTTTGLEVFLKGSEREDRLLNGQRDADGARVFVHHPMQLPEAGKGLLLAERHDHVLTVRVSVAVTESQPNLRGLSAADRHCYFPDEWTLQVSRTYSQRNCLVECRLQFIADKCNCVPYFFNGVNDKPVCNLTSMYCVAAIDRSLRFVRLQPDGARRGDGFLDCMHCLPACDDMAYAVVADTAPDTNPQQRAAYLDVYYADLSAVKYRRERAFDTMQLIVSFGGIASLFLGVSLLSGAELLYYAGAICGALLKPLRRPTDPASGSSPGAVPGQSPAPAAFRDRRKVWAAASHPLFEARDVTFD